MLVSIITPSYNQGEYLEETILSVINQDYTDIEYLVIDGGSSDNSKEIISKYADRLSYWVSEPDRGQADAINKGFRKVKGDLICWINSDDILYPDFVSTRVRQFSENPNIDFIYGDVEQGIDMNHKKLRKGTQTDFKTMLASLIVPIPQQSAIWRRSVIEKIGVLDIQWDVLLDREYFMRIARNCQIIYKPGTVAFFRNHNKSKSILGWRKWADELERYYNLLFSDVLDSEIQSLRTFSLAAMYYKCSQICEDCNDINGKYKYLSLSNKMDPKYSIMIKLNKKIGSYFHRKCK